MLQTQPDAGMDIVEKVVLILAGVLLTTLFQFVSSLLTRRSDKSLKHKDQLKLLSSELEDLTRHCIANLQVLKSFDLSKGIPSSLHLQKMKIMESSILFSPDTFQIISSDYTRFINRLRLEIRNINLEIDYLLNYKQRQDFKPEVFQQYTDYLVSKMETTITMLPERLRDLTVVNEAIVDRIKAHKEENAKTLRKIIYD